MRELIRLTMVGVVAGLVLSGCGMPDEVGEVEPVSFNNVDELFQAVDRHLGCPEGSSGTYAFDAGDEHGLVTGRRCAESVVMVHSQNEDVIDEIQDRLSTAQGGPLPMVHDSTWFVIDITEVAQSHRELTHPDSRDLKALATALRTDYTEL
ncbi:MAG TPA: hypothetical protein K8V32_10425 [Enteractinococcus helveticum]|uniref:Uncharacterized protein n=1 Tax=Enteractinococcus helveticum TaxID=1837282 RepID=A0A921FN62_9MICC|nr:hypothetical protein [Enteractinococcus helveticum]HJF15198.1 hypothetical protein [Enteractinococcus helveticum]